MVINWPSKTYQKKKKNQKRRSEFNNVQQQKTSTGIYEQEQKNKEISKLLDKIEHHKNIISRGSANKEAQKKMLDKIKKYEQRILNLSDTKHKEEKEISDMLAKYGLKLKPKKKNKLGPVKIATSLSIVHKSDKIFTPINLQAAKAVGYKGKTTKSKKR